MRAPVLLATALFLASCGGGPYDGTYAGTLSNVTNCDDGSSATDNPTVRWDVSTSGTSLTVDPHGTCGTYSGTLFETSGTLQPKTCSSTSQFKGAQLTFSPTSVIVNVTATVLKGAVTCNGTVSGTLTRQ